MILAVSVLACEPEPAMAPRPGRPGVELTATEAAEAIIEGLVVAMCEADQGCDVPAYTSVRVCECAGLAEPVTAQLDPAAAQPCLDALESARLVPCNPFDPRGLPTACMDLLTVPEAPAEVVVLSTNGRGATTARDCGEPPSGSCAPRVLEPGCVVDAEAYEQCHTGAWTCDDEPASCHDVVVCPGDD